MKWKQKDPAFFRTMALLWLFPSLGAWVIFWMSPSESLWSLEKMMAGAILMVHALLVYRWMTSGNKM